MNHSHVQLAAGLVRGSIEGGLHRFLGIPYAAAPVGARRFQVPAVAPAWEGERDATVQGATSPQFIGPFPELDILALVGPGWAKGDDYLNVNVWTPNPQATGLPVMVFIHGGGFIGGSNSAPVQEGTAFARSGVVYVALNYRLGVEGFVPMDGAPTNLGLRDQLFALQWVQDNITAFGGDPANVTVFGESAGAMSIGNLVASPLAKGLFRRAIIQSGHGSMVRPITVGKRLAVRLAKLLGVTPDVAGFSTRTNEQCVDALVKVSKPTSRLDLRDAHGRDPSFGLSRFLPVYGDDVLPLPPLEALRQGVGAEVELLIGTNAEEMNLYFVPTGVKRKINRWLAWYVVKRVEPLAWKVLKAYGLGQRGKRAGEAFTEALHDLVFRYPARLYALAHQGRTHFYEFEWKSPAFNGQLGACHAIEIPFVFNTLGCCSGPKGFVGEAPPQALADRVHALWAGFARDGKLPWDPFAPQTRLVYQLEQGVAITDPVMPVAQFLP